MSLQEKLDELAAKYSVPGAVAGVISADTTDVAAYGVTNIDHPLPVGEGDRYVVAAGEGKGMRGYFFRGDDGVVAGVNFSGRDMTKR